MTRIYLVGFMGAGKTTVASILAEQLKCQQVDMDDEIIRVAKKSIPQIFEEGGEAHFRQIETKVLKTTTTLDQCVIATGGGVISRSENREILAKEYVVWLKVPFITLYQRVKKDTNRPLATSYEQLEALFEKRQAYYSEVATYIVDAKEKTSYEIAEEIIQRKEEEDENSCS